MVNRIFVWVMSIYWWCGSQEGWPLFCLYSGLYLFIMFITRWSWYIYSTTTINAIDSLVVPSEINEQKAIVWGSLPALWIIIPICQTIHELEHNGEVYDHCFAHNISLSFSVSVNTMNTGSVRRCSASISGEKGTPRGSANGQKVLRGFCVVLLSGNLP